jgi:hypothetical protein
MSVSELFEVNEEDTVWDAWLTTVNLLDMLEHTHRIGEVYDFGQARSKIAKICTVAENHKLDRNGAVCKCGLSGPEHAMLKRKILTFFSMQVSSLKHFIH